jgi:hypothetical protein
MIEDYVLTAEELTALPAERGAMVDRVYAILGLAMYEELYGAPFCTDIA